MLIMEINHFIIWTVTDGGWSFGIIKIGFFISKFTFIWQTWMVTYNSTPFGVLYLIPKWLEKMKITPLLLTRFDGTPPYVEHKMTRIILLSINSLWSTNVILQLLVSKNLFEWIFRKLRILHFWSYVCCFLVYDDFTAFLLFLQ